MILENAIVDFTATMANYHLDHFVLTVKDIDETCEFYQAVLQIPVITFGKNRKALQLGLQKINLHCKSEPFKPQAGIPTVGAADFCLITDIPIAQFIRHLQIHHVAVEAGPVERTGAQGRILSIYIRDPDDNLIEVANSL